MPRWPLAQPMRLLGHNGEINTLLGNINWMMAREADLSHAVWQDRLEVLKPTVNADNSDSANLDNVFELLVQSGRSPQEALMIMVPEAYQNQPDLQNRPEIVDFYEYHSGMQEAWDGPALLVFSDGKTVGSHSRSQRAAAGPLQHHPRWLCHRLFGSRSGGLCRNLRLSRKVALAPVR